MQGEEAIIEQDGKPVAKVSPVQDEEDWFGMDDDFDETPEDIIEAFERNVNV